MSRTLRIMEIGTVLAIAITTIVLIYGTIAIPTDDTLEPTSIHYFCKTDSFDIDYTEDDILAYPVGPHRTVGLFFNAYHFVTLDDPVLSKLYDAIEPCIDGKSDQEKADYLCRFVYNNFDYESDEGKHGYSEYFQYASETILSGTGDCEDFAILLYNLYKLAGLDAKLVLTVDHAFVAVDVGGFGDTIVPLLSIREFTYADPVYTNTIGEGHIDGYEIAFSPSIVPLTEFIGILAVILGIILLKRRDD